MPYRERKTRIDYQRDLRKKYDAAGLCTRCGGARDSYQMDCKLCRDKSQALVKEIVQKNLQAGLCRCGKQPRELKKVCQQCSEVSKRVIRDLKKKVLAGYGSHCACCNTDIQEFLGIDHKDERGVDERHRLGAERSSGSFYRKIIREHFPQCYQLLCFNCNMALGLFGYCPHRPEITRPVFKINRIRKISAG